MDVINTIKPAFMFIPHELDVFLAFTWRDLSSTLVPGSFFAVSAALHTPQLSLATFICRYMRLILWITFFIYFFTLSNQIKGVEEDRINKPDRPIPAGKVALAGAQRRLAVVLSAFLTSAAIAPMLLPETLCWVLTTLFLCATSAGDHWFGKNFIGMSVGTWALLNASWRAIAPVTPKAQRYILAVSLWCGLTMHMQDLRDVAGDTVIGRRTLPIVFGDRLARSIITFLLLPVSLVVLWMGGIVRLAPLTLGAVHLYLGYRVMHTRGARYDHKTHMIWSYVFGLLVALLAGEGLTLEMSSAPQWVFK